MNAHNAICSCSVELCNHAVVYFSGFFAKLDHFAGFSLYISLMSQDTPPSVIFRGFFLYTVLFAGKISEAAMCRAEVGGHNILCTGDQHYKYLTNCCWFLKIPIDCCCLGGGDVLAGYNIWLYIPVPPPPQPGYNIWLYIPVGPPLLQTNKTEGEIPVHTCDDAGRQRSTTGKYLRYKSGVNTWFAPAVFNTSGILPWYYCMEISKMRCRIGSILRS